MEPLWKQHARTVPATPFLPGEHEIVVVGAGITGLATLDPAVIEAADGIGMTRGQRLRLVEAPLVLPVLMAGIRTAATWTIGAATLATTIGQASLGDLIFAGLQTQNWALVLAGCVAAAGLALVVDWLLGVIEQGVATRRPRRAWFALALIALGTLAATAPLWPRAEGRVITIGTKNFGYNLNWIMRQPAG